MSLGHDTSEGKSSEVVGVWNESAQQRGRAWKVGRSEKSSEKELDVGDLWLSSDVTNHSEDVHRQALPGNNGDNDDGDDDKGEDMMMLLVLTVQLLMGTMG